MWCSLTANAILPEHLCVFVRDYMLGTRLSLSLVAAALTVGGAGLARCLVWPSDWLDYAIELLELNRLLMGVRCC